MTHRSEVDVHGGFGVDHLPYGSPADTAGHRFAAVRIGDHALDLTALTARETFGELFADGGLGQFLEAGPAAWAAVRAMVTSRLAEPEWDAGIERALVPLAETVDRLPVVIGDYVDFYASEHHATTVGRIFRPNGEPLTPNWKHLPIGYHGRAGTIVVSGTPIRRPHGQFRGQDAAIGFGLSQRLDFEAEVGFIVGSRTELGQSIPLGRARDFIFGVCLVNDWSARDIQAWESVPLGPFLGKSFGTSISAWITPLSALDHAWIAPPPRIPAVLPYLADDDRRDGLDLAIDIAVNGQVISRAPFASMYWTSAQMLAHLTVNGASVRLGDLFASGTVSGPGELERGCLLELTSNGAVPLELVDGRALRFLEDGDEVVLTATAPTGTGRLTLAECRGRVQAGARQTAR